MIHTQQWVSHKVNVIGRLHVSRGVAGTAVHTDYGGVTATATGAGAAKAFLVGQRKKVTAAEAMVVNDNMR